MSRELKINLTDAQCDALADEAKARNVRFFDHCREKLLAGISAGTAPVGIVDWAIHRTAREAPPMQTPDRIDRLEAMMMNMAQAIENLAHPMVQAEPQQPIGEFDVNDVISGALADVERAPVIQQDVQQMTEGVRHVGTRAPTPFTRAVPRHLANQFPS